MQVLTIDEMLFRMAFDRDVDCHDSYPQSTYLDRQTGEILWVYKEDEDAQMEVGIPPAENQSLREHISASPGRYLKIPGLNHGDHHDILRKFLASEWTDDEAAKGKAQAAYFGSIGGWKKTVKDGSAIYAFNEFRDQQMQRMAEEFLSQHGIEPQWK